MPRKSQKKPFFIEVAPLTSIPVARSPFFTYLSSVAIEPGTLVLVPFSKRELRGVVYACVSVSHTKKLVSFRYKHILSVLEKNFLTREQLRLARLLSEEYYTSLGRCLIHFTPRIAQNRKELKPAHFLPGEKKKIRLTLTQEKAVATITRSKQGRFYLFGPASSGKTEVYMRSIRKLLKKNEQALVLIPEITQLFQEAKRYGEFFGAENITVLYSHLSPGQYSAAWESVRQGKARIILGTRQALFAPFKKLRLIVVDEEQDDAYKQWDMSPRYVGQKVAKELAELHHATLIFGSAAPNVERFFETQEKKLALLTLSPLPKQPDIFFEIADLKLERYRKSFSPLSEVLTRAIRSTLNNKQQILLFINRQGGSRFSVCASCRTLLACPTCERALVYDTKRGVYYCLHCGYRTDAFPQCGKCGSLEFKNFGWGTLAVEREVGRHFSRARFGRLDAQSVRKTGARENIFSRFAAGDIDILIGTQMAMQGLDLPGIALVGIIDADALFAFPDFRTDEKAYQLMVAASGRTGRIGSTTPGTVILQTFHPENPVIQSVAKRDYKNFYQHTLEERRAFGYPPFSRLVKLIYQDKNRVKLEKEIQKVYGQWTRLNEQYPFLRIFPPQEPMVNKIRGRYHKHLVISIPKEKKWPDEMYALLTTLSGKWAVDVDPISLM